MAVLDSQCKFPCASEDSLLQNLKEHLGQHSHFTASPRTPAGCFVIQHYAGDVQYNVGGFLDKNKDALSLDITILMQVRRAVDMRDVFSCNLCRYLL